MEAEALAVSEKHRFKNVVISGRFCREDSNLGPSKNSSHRRRRSRCQRQRRTVFSFEEKETAEAAAIERIHIHALKQVRDMKKKTIKAELTERGLDAMGSEMTLIKRLESALEEEALAKSLDIYTQELMWTSRVAKMPHNKRIDAQLKSRHLSREGTDEEKRKVLAKALAQEGLTYFVQPIHFCSN